MSVWISGAQYPVWVMAIICMIVAYGAMSMFADVRDYLRQKRKSGTDVNS